MSAGRGLTEIALPDLQHLLARDRRGSLRPPLSPAGLQAAGLGHLAPHLAGLGALDAAGLAAVIEVAVAERRHRPAPRLELVWTGPEATTSLARDTAVVVRELFARARSTVLVAGFSFDHGASLLEPLHHAIAEREVSAALYLHLNQLEDADDFLQRNWPFGAPYPNLFCDPRTIAVPQRASLHAKCIVIDRRHTFISSANFTDRGHTRNIEVGVLIEDPTFAAQLDGHFQRARDAGLFTPVSPPILGKR